MIIILILIGYSDLLDLMMPKEIFKFNLKRILLKMELLVVIELVIHITYLCIVEISYWSKILDKNLII